ncbi:MAG TPA: STAS domain-containing protein [Ilumatobacteraceae bacterium]|nr:STAS domain-containing protein [Ilumatobacteraceae bacterium]
MTEDESAALAQLLVERSNDVLSAWERRLSPSVRSQISATELQAELRLQWDAFVAGIASGRDTRGDSFAELRGLLAELSITRARQGFSPTETADSVFALKGALLDVLGTADLERHLALSSAIDDLTFFTFERYVAARDAVIVSQTEQLLELSTPVVKIWDEVLAVPLVGTLDSARTQVVMETLLQALVDTGSTHAIIDITGVAAVDTQVAQHLLKTVVAARLMGAECVISGIRPQIAQTVVALGIEFGDIPTRASMAEALRWALGRAGFDVVRRDGTAS